MPGQPIPQRNNLQITLYTRPNCQQCRAVKRWLDKRNIKFATVDVSQSLEDTEALRALGYMGAPVIIVNDGTKDTHFYGFNVDLLETYCNPKNTP